MHDALVPGQGYYSRCGSEEREIVFVCASQVGAALISALSQPSVIPCLLLDVGGKLWCHL